jgi:FMN-dependent oxidoreductase (nitrilotriacetate monooxygenase family)
LWDSWEDDAFTYDKESGVFFDPDKLHSLNHRGEFFHVAGPLNIQRSKQGHPVLLQAGGSDQGRGFAAKYADAIFAAITSLDAARAYGGDVKARAANYGRRPEDIVFMPRISPVIGRTASEAEEKYIESTKLVSWEEAIGNIGFLFHHDFSRYNPDGPFPDLEGLEVVRENRSMTDESRRDAYERRLTLREAALECTTPRSDFIGTPETVSAALEHWATQGAADGFIIRRSSFDEFLDGCIPILQDRGLFRTEYESDTFRGNMGLAPVPNRYAAARAR